MPVTLSLVAVAAGLKRAVGLAGELRGDDVRHLVERRDQAVALAVGLGAFAQGEDVGIAGAHGGRRPRCRG